MRKKLLSFDDLIRFCESNHLTYFNANDSGYRLSIQLPVSFSKEQADDNHRGMQKIKVKIFHTGLNRNGSYVSESAAKKAMQTISDRPILAAIHQLDDGSWDFESHEIEIIENENGEEEINYIEKQVGSFSSEPAFWEHDDETDKDFVCAYAYIPEEYTRAADIIRTKNGTKNSCELNIEQMAYNAKDRYLDLQKFYISGSTLLGSRADGTEIKEGMLGSRADIVDFSENNNSVFSQNNKLIESLDRLTEQLANFNINNPTVGGETKKGGSNLVNKFEELLKKYGKTVDDIDFEYEDLSNEDLEAKFAEVFGEAAGEGEGEPESTPDEDGEKKVEEFDGDDPVDDPVGEPKDETTVTVTEEDVHTALDGVTEEELIESIENRESDELASVVLDVLNDNDVSAKKSDFAVTYGGNTVNFAVSMSEVLSAMSELVNNTYADSDGDYYSVDVYEADKFVVMQGVWTGKAFRQSYKVRNNVYSLTGDRVPVKAVYVTADEEAELDKMRSNYSLIESKLEKYESEPQKVAILESEDYSNISDVKEFVELKKQENHFDLSVDEVTEKANQILLDYAKHNSIQFSEDEKKNVGMNRLPAGGKKKSSRYGNLFKK